MSGRMQALYRQNLIVMITSAKLLHLWPPELGRSLFTLWNYRGVGKNAPNRRWKNGPQFCVGFFGFAGNAACSLRAISVCEGGRCSGRPIATPTQLIGGEISTTEIGKIEGGRDKRKDGAE